MYKPHQIHRSYAKRRQFLSIHKLFDEHYLLASAGLSARLGSLSGIWAGFAFAVTLLASALVLSLARTAPCTLVLKGF